MHGEYEGFNDAIFLGERFLIHLRSEASACVIALVKSMQEQRCYILGRAIPDALTMRLLYTN